MRKTGFLKDEELDGILYFKAIRFKLKVDWIK